MLHPDSKAAVKQLLEMITMYEGIVGDERNKTDVFVCALIIKGMPRDKAEEAVKIIREAVPMRASYEKLIA